MAIRITRVYTRRGDAGETDLVGQKRVPKDSSRIVAYGTIDELNSVLGIARAHAGARAGEAGPEGLVTILEKIQNELFDLGSELATPPDGEYEGMWKTSAAHVKALEETLDGCQETLEPLRSFILPGGGILAATLHHARTVCRRAEIEILRLSREEEINREILRYVNRLSDLLFVLARWIAKETGEPEILWERGLSLPRGRAPKRGPASPRRKRPPRPRSV